MVFGSFAALFRFLRHQCTCGLRAGQIHDGGERAVQKARNCPP